MSSYYPFSLASILAVVLAAPVHAQDKTQPPAQPSIQQGVISYVPSDFADARPDTALDMIGRLPGFSFDGGDSVRGFAGAAGNVLIDGQRPTIKTDALGGTLSRITIDQVERIDVIRGSVPGIDMQGQTVVANVIRKKVDTFQQVFSVRGFLFEETGKTIPGWNYQATRRVGEHQFDVSAGRGIAMDDSVGSGWRTTIDAATGNLNRFETSRSEGDGVVHSLRGSYKGPQFGGTLSVNSVISTDEFKNEQMFLSPASDEFFVNRSANDSGEVGANYLTKLGSDLEWETLGLAKLEVGALDATGLLRDPTGIAPVSTQLFQIEAETGERIGRTTLRYKMSLELSFEGGGEMTYNYLDQQVALAVDGTPIVLPASDVLVEETRGELFVQSTWRPSPQWTLEGGVRLEQSTITQSGDTNKERSFTQPKPRIVGTWSPAEGDQLRVRIEREVGQLDFQDFASEVDLNSGQQNTGNSDLEPAKTWVYEAAYEKRLWDGVAVILTLRHEDISDVVDLFPRRIPVDTDDDGVNDGTTFVEGPGNIGDGTNDAVNLNLTLPLRNIGWEGAEVKVEAQWQESQVTDPLTSETRRISGQRPETISINFRQDLPEQKLTFGFGWFQGWRESYYQGSSIDNLRLRDFFDSFVEWKPDTGFTLRAELNNLDPFSFNIERQRYGRGRDLDPLIETETERRNSQVLGMLSARWTFS